MPTLYEYYNTGDDITLNNRSVGALENWGAQTFTPSISHAITVVRLKLYRLGSPGTVTVSIRATNVSSKPAGADLCSGTRDGNAFTTDPNGAWYSFSLGAGYNLIAGTQYAILHRNFGAGDNISYWRADNSSPTYAGGEYLESWLDGGILEWDPVGLTIDTMFEEWSGMPAGNLAVKGTKIHYIDNSGEERYRLGTLIAPGGNQEGNITVKQPNFQYVDNSGDQRYIKGTLVGVDGGSSMPYGSLAVVGTKVHYVDNGGSERYFEGTPV